MMNVILHRSVDLIKCPAVLKSVTLIFEELAKILPSLQCLISVRESLFNRTNIKKQTETTDAQGLICSHCN